MEKLFENLRDSVVNFKLNLCCFVARVRVGTLLFGYFNLITSVLSVISAATGSVPTLYMKAQQTIMDAEYVKSSCAVAYSAEVCASVLLLCGMYREDVILLKYFTYVAMGMAGCSLVVYAMVIGVLDMLTTLTFIVSLSYQVYLVLLVRSVMVEIKQAARRNRYRVNLRLNDVESAEYIPLEKYSVVIEPETTIIEPEASPVLPVRQLVDEPAVDEAKSDVIAKDIEEEGINEEQEKKLRYPFKFVAIKIPKEGTSKEEEDKNKEKKESEHKDVKEEHKDKSDEEVVREIIRPPRRSIFGRKKKDKLDSKTKTNDDETTKS